MAIRFEAVEPGAAKPGEAEALHPEADRPPGDAARSAGPEPAAGEPAGDEAPLPPAGSEPRPRRRRKAAAPEPEPVAPSVEAPADIEAPEAIPLLFPDLPVHARSTAKARKNRHGFG